MALVEEIKKLELWEVSVVLVCFLATVAPGALILDHGCTGAIVGGRCIHGAGFPGET